MADETFVHLRLVLAAGPNPKAKTGGKKQTADDLLSRCHKSGGLQTPVLMGFPDFQASPLVMT